ncbi:hypothetical protein GCM10009665_77050 [Kitasatospora nipponensis]|uniref:Major facilitator superfamily (MFS) profile domain-containing protein n=1 Tax=Kitasatospora nipponensis TaxID=258049 RepID=A0ABN1T8H9_9ACTN
MLLAALAAPAAAGISGPSLTLPAIAHDLRIGSAPVAWVMTAYTLGMLVGTPLLAGTAGRRGVRPLLTVSGVLLALGVVLTLAGHGLPLLIVGRATEAIGAAGFNTAAFQLAGRDRTGRAAGLVAIGSAAGGTAGLFVGAAVAQLIGWQAALVLPVFSLLLLPALLPTLPAADVPHGTEVARKASGVRRLPALAPLTGRRFRLAAALMLLLSTVNFALVYGAPRRAAHLTGWAPVQTGAVASLVALAGALLSWVLVRAAGRLGARRTGVVLAGGSLGALLLASASPWAPGVLLGTGLSAFVTASGQGVLTGVAASDAPGPRRAEAIALFNLVFLLGASLGPQLAAVAHRTVQFIY